MGYLAEEIRALGIETEIEDEDEEILEDDLQKKLEDLKVKYASAEEDGDDYGEERANYVWHALMEQLRKDLSLILGVKIKYV